MGWSLFMTFAMNIMVSVIIPIVAWDGGIRGSRGKAIMVDKSPETPQLKVKRVINKKIRGRFTTTSYLETHCEFLTNPNLNK